VLLVIIYFYFPEIKGLTLDEISHVFDKGRKGDRSAGVDVLQQHGAVDEVEVEVRDDTQKKDFDGKV
jgi:hypothetical protein